ncbi:MAG TPA: DUF3419 domain-containing protein [Saprospirales bacterium]|nr:DUF3419 domain-containing protein [Saprospirales bacterium]
MVSRLKQKIFQTIHGGNLVYNTCWEDPRCDRALMKFDQNSRIVMLTSAGCNALDYLLDNPISIDCIDVNPRQNALLELKTKIIQHADFHLLFEWFGKGYSAEANALFREVLAPDLSEYSKNYWERNLHFFTGSRWRKSFYWFGSAGSAAFMLHKRLVSRPHIKQKLEDLLVCSDLSLQRDIYEQLEPLVLDGFTRWLLNRHVFQSMLGVPQMQQNLAKEGYAGGMAGYIRECLRNVFVEQSLTENYFWKVYLQGHYTTDCCPNYLKEEYFPVLQKSVPRIKTHTSTLSEYLKQNPGTYTHFILLDHQDWMATHNFPALEEEWRHLLLNSVPGTQFLLRSAAQSVDFIPKFVHERVEFQSAANFPSLPIDRVGTYVTTLKGIFKY